MSSLQQVFSAASAKSVKMDGMPAGTVRMSPNEAFAVLRGLKCRPFYFGMAKYASDDRSRDMLYSLLKRDADKLFKDRKWAVRKPGILDRACELVIDMHVYPQISYCRTCLGSGHTARGILCKPCGGSGRKAMSNREISRKLEVDESTFRESWNLKIDTLYRRVSGWEQEAQNHVRNSGI